MNDQTGPSPSALGSATAQAEAPVSVLLHLSDTHFGDENAQVLEDLMALVLQERPQAVVATGDITEHAKPAEFAAAARFFSRLAAHHQLVVPGNHDLPLWDFPLWDLPRRLVAPYAAFRHAFGEDLEPRLQTADIWVAGLCSTRRWRHHEGTLSDAQVLRSAQWLSTAPAGALRVVALHHPVSAGLPAEVHNAAFAVDTWSRAGVHLVLGGHTHRPGFVVLPRAAGAAHSAPMWAAQAGTAVSLHLRGPQSQSVNVLRRVGAGSWRVEQWTHAAASSAFVLSDWVSIAPGFAINSAINEATTAVVTAVMNAAKTAAITSATSTHESAPATATVTAPVTAPVAAA